MLDLFSLDMSSIIDESKNASNAPAALNTTPPIEPALEQANQESIEHALPTPTQPAGSLFAFMSVS